METHFTWIPAYAEIARRLAHWEDRQRDLITFVERLRKDGLTVTPMMDKDEKGARFLLEEIDPFSFLGTFNRRISNDQRFAILAEVLKFLGATVALPTDFSGIPLVNNQKSWFFAYRPGRGKDDVHRLWTVFKMALEDKPLENPEFLKSFDAALEVPNTNINLTMGLFWIRPDTFLNLDSVNRQYLKIKLPPAGLNSTFYLEAIRGALERGQPFYELSHKAWLAAKKIRFRRPIRCPPRNADYWMVGSFWDGSDLRTKPNAFLKTHLGKWL